MAPLSFSSCIVHDNDSLDTVVKSTGQIKGLILNAHGRSGSVEKKIASLRVRLLSSDSLDSASERADPDLAWIQTR